MDTIENCSKKVIIAGPCAFENREQLRSCVRVIRQLGLSMIRAPLWKPRTQPGWDGIGSVALSLLLEETLPQGVIPATEILCADHALAIVQALEHFGPDSRMIVWIGSRNQNHVEQRKIARILADGPQGISLMYKNQMWDDESHWLGIHEHIIAEKFPAHRLMSCHRGFHPGKIPNPQGWRNIPDFEMAMRVKTKTGTKMLLDPSHIGGSRQRVVDICTMALHYDFDGLLIEMHHDPDRAKTDAKQQLSPDQLHTLLQKLGQV